MQTFAGLCRFDEYGFPDDWDQTAAYIPRANFDTLCNASGVPCAPGLVVLQTVSPERTTPQ